MCLTPINGLRNNEGPHDSGFSARHQLPHHARRRFAPEARHRATILGTCLARGCAAARVDACPDGIRHQAGCHGLAVAHIPDLAVQYSPRHQERRALRFVNADAGCRRKSHSGQNGSATDRSSCIRGHSVYPHRRSKYPEQVCRACALSRLLPVPGSAARRRFRCGLVQRRSKGARITRSGLERSGGTLVPVTPDSVAFDSPHQINGCHRPHSIADRKTSR